jgi:FkbM family methyltransferase
MKRGGYFVEIGAANGVRLSNTYMLEKEFGWSGIVAEPNPAFAPSLKKNRKCFVSTKCLYTASGETIGFLPAAKGEFSRISSIVPDDQHEKDGMRQGSEIMVSTITLNDLLIEAAAPKLIDYLSIDTEGSEFVILASVPFNEWDIRTITVEHNNAEAKRQQIFDLLMPYGYVRKWTGLSKFD